MTRKKFVKQLMAMGIQRNDANGKALLACLQKVPYKRRLAEIKFHNSLSAGMKRFADNARKLAEAIQKVAEAAKKARASMQLVHHPTPYDPKNVAGSLGNNLQIVTPAEHAALHGYHANIVLVDELHGQGGGGA